MKGIEKIKAFLNSGKPQSAMQKDLSHLQVDREAILQVLWDQHQNLKARTDVQTTEQPRAPTLDAAAAEEGEKKEVENNVFAKLMTAAKRVGVWEEEKQDHGDPAPWSGLKASAPPFVPTHATAALSATTGAEASAPPSHATAGGGKPRQAKPSPGPSAESGRVVKPEAERLCVSMWGIKPCPGTASSECLRKHIPLCSNVICYGNEEVRKACANGGKWHGHIRGLIRAEKKNEKEREFKKDFTKAWQERRNKPQGNSFGGPLQSQQGQPQRHQAKGQKGPTQAKGQKGPTQAKGQKGPTQPRRQTGWNQKPPGPGPRTLGDFFPAPAPVGNAWARPLVTPQVTPQSAPPVSAGADAKQQILHLLQNIGQLGQLLQSTGF